MKRCVLAKQSPFRQSHMVGGRELRVNPGKVKAITNWPTPRNITETRSFVRVIQCIKKHIPNSSKITAVLHVTSDKIQEFSMG